MADPWQDQREVLGAFIRNQRQLANLSLRQLASMTSLSNPYLSQVERGLHQPSVRVLKAISDALNLSTEALLAQAGLVDATDSEDPADKTDPDTRTEDAIRADQRLTDEQRTALIAVYRSMVARPWSGPGTHLEPPPTWPARRTGPAGRDGLRQVRMYLPGPSYSAVYLWLPVGGRSMRGPELPADHRRVLPPGTIVAGGVLAPLVGRGRMIRSHHVPAFGTGRVDDAAI